MGGQDEPRLIVRLFWGDRTDYAREGKDWTDWVGNYSPTLGPPILAKLKSHTSN